MPREGDRVRITGVMPNDPCPLEVGEMGTVVGLNPMPPGSGFGDQIFVRWDTGRSLILLADDPFEVVTEAINLRTELHQVEHLAQQAIRALAQENEGDLLAAVTEMRQRVQAMYDLVTTW